MLEKIKQRGRELKIQIIALSLAYRDPRTPWYAKAWAILVLAYAISPIDLIPDFLPVIGYLDDLLILPLGVVIAVKLVPPQVWEEARAKARLEDEVEHRFGWVGAAMIVAFWLIILAVLLFFIFHFSSRKTN
jgi:uncharacterized membrane protein YkvA (DUF1232 family)